MTDAELIQQAIETCIHQMCDVTVGVDDVEWAVDNYGFHSIAKDHQDDTIYFKFKPSGQVLETNLKTVTVCRREDVPNFFPWLEGK